MNIIYVTTDAATRVIASDNTFRLILGKIRFTI